jgi:hypothetical protein
MEVQCILSEYSKYCLLFLLEAEGCLERPMLSICKTNSCEVSFQMLRNHSAHVTPASDRPAESPCVPPGQCFCSESRYGNARTGGSETTRLRTEQCPRSLEPNYSHRVPFLTCK